MKIKYGLIERKKIKKIKYTDENVGWDDHSKNFLANFKNR